MELLWTDGTGEEYAPLITADVTGTVLGVLPHTVVTVPVSFRDGGQLGLIGRGGGRRNITFACKTQYNVYFSRLYMKEGEWEELTNF